MKKAELVSGLVLLAFGLCLWAVLIPWQVAESPDAVISPRMMPYLCATLIVVLSLILIAQSWMDLRRNADAGPAFTRAEVLSTLGVIVLFGVAAALFVFTGPLLPGIAIVLLPMLALGERRILVLTLLPAALMGGAWLLFYVALGTSFQ